MWGLQSCHPAPFLINQDRGHVVVHAAAQILDQGFDLFRAFAIALKQDEAQRLHVLKKRTLFGAELKARTTENSS